MSKVVDADILDIEADHRGGRRFFLAWLVMATVLTLAGNAADALVHEIDPLVVRLAVRVIPPTVALVALHGLTVLSRAGGKQRAVKMMVRDRVFMASLVVTTLVALAAAVLSYDGLYDLALAGGLRPSRAWLFPLCIDAEILVASVALVALRPASTADIRAAREAAKVAAPAERARVRTNTPEADSRAPAPARVEAPARESVRATPARTERTAPSARTESSAHVTDAHLTRARALVAANATRAHEADVARALALMDAGASTAEIANSSGIKRDAQRRLRRADAERTLDQSSADLDAELVALAG